MSSGTTVEEKTVSRTMFSSDDWYLALVDPLLKRPVIWRLNKPEMTVSFVHG
jgi:hypothetical protein